MDKWNVIKRLLICWSNNLTIKDLECIILKIKQNPEINVIRFIWKSKQIRLVQCEKKWKETTITSIKTYPWFIEQDDILDPFLYATLQWIGLKNPV